MRANVFNETRAQIAFFQQRVELSRAYFYNGKFAGDEIAANKNSGEMFIARTRSVASENQISVLLYQLDLVTPGMSPCEASSRKVRRDILNLRIKARRRPVTSQRLTTRVGLASRGNCVSAA